jgi:predicted LPLAT superfamily acyltransferase
VKFGGIHWSAVAERGDVWGLRFMFAAYRLLGRGVFTVLLYPVVGYFYVTGRRARHASHDYLSAVRAQLAREGRPIPRGMNVFQHVVAFGNGLLDKLAMWAGALPASSLEFADLPVLKQFTEGRGVLFIGSHHGNLEVLRAFGEQIQGLKVNTLVSTRNSKNWMRVLKAVSPQTLENMIQIDSLGPEAVIALRDKLAAGEHVAILSDRVSVNHRERSIRAPFLGRPAPFPEGPFVLASLLECPVYLLFCLKIGGKYHVSVEPFADPLVLPRRERRALLERAIVRYAERLEAHCLLAPMQWFNFFDFWGAGGE